MVHPSLSEQLAAKVKQGDHVCIVCDDQRECLEAAAEYLASGLRQNERVMYAADAETTRALRASLEQRGIDVADALGRGALLLPTAEDAYLREGTFNPDAVYDEFEQAISSAKAAGFAGCRFAGEPLWALDRETLRPGLLEFEARLNTLFSSREAAGLCVYDKRAWPASIVRDVLLTHPTAVVGDLLCTRNVFYGRPDLVDQTSSPESQVAAMLAQLREVRSEEARLQVALEAGRLGSWELDLRTNTSVRSLRHDQIFGYDHAVARWGYDRFMEHVVPEDRERVAANFEQALESATTWQFECRIRRANDGMLRWIEAHGRPGPERTADGKICRLLGIVADITERKNLEQALRDADRRKDEFLATLAHELRNPLAPITNALQLLRLRAPSDPQLLRAAAIIDRQSKHLVRLVDDLLEISRISTGRINLERSRIELNAVLASAIEASQPLIDASGHELVVSIPDEPVHLDGDATRLAQVFLNILNNAAKYTPPGGRIELTASRAGDDVIVRVRDTGIGIPAELLPHVFTMFVQGHKTGERAQGGLGIGLSLARQLLELHGGSIEARSEGPGKGSELIVQLPAAVAQAASSEGAAARLDKPDSKRILVVDDNVDAADCLAETFELLGHQASARYDGQSALEAATSLEPDVIILDIGLPDVDGYEIARRIRASNRKVTLVALTGWGQERDRNLAHAAGFDQHRTKPVDPEELLATLATPG